MLIELSGGQDDGELAERLAQALLAAGADDAVLAQDQSQMAALWALRERIPAAQQRQGPSITHDLALPISAIPAFLQAAASLLRRDFASVDPVVFGHVGDGNLHYNLGVATQEAMLAVEPQVTAALFALAIAMGGDISAEHGIGRIRREAADAQHDPVERALMRQIKQLFDPQGLFNPDVLV